MNTELLEALTILEKEKNISKDVMMEAIENSLLSACKNHFGTSDNIKIVMDRETCDYSVLIRQSRSAWRMQKRSIRPCTSVISPRFRFIQKNSVVLQRRMQKT